MPAGVRRAPLWKDHLGRLNVLGSQTVCAKLEVRKEGWHDEPRRKEGGKAAAAVYAKLLALITPLLAL